MILGVCGFGFSGSGAVLDWLKEYPDINVLDKLEFSFIYKPDGLIDLGNAVCYHPSRYFSSDSAIRRFIQYMTRISKRMNTVTGGQYQQILDDYLSKVVQITWKGSTSVHSYQASTLDYIFRQLIPRYLRWHIENRLHIIARGSYWPEKKMFFSVMTEDDFLDSSKRFISEIVESMSAGEKKRIIALDQCFSANDPIEGFKFFDYPKAITVIRDPRDTYLLAKQSRGFDISFIPKQSVDDFIVYYKGLMESRRYGSLDKGVIEIRFEDLIYQPYDTFAHLETELGLPHIEVDSFTHFKPSISINNTQLWNKYPQYHKDVEIIQNKLSDYLFPFESFNVKPTYKSRTF